MDRFWKKVAKTDGCWLWKAAKTGSGYGTFLGLDRKMVMAHRFGYVLQNGPIPRGVQVLHRCDEKLCVRGDHLFLGSQQDNMDDMWNKGRGATGARLNHLRQDGEMNNGAKTTAEVVNQVKQLYSSGVRQCDLMKMFSLTRANVWAIVHGKSWRNSL